MALACITALVAVLEWHGPVGWNCLACRSAECRTQRRVAKVPAAYSVLPPRSTGPRHGAARPPASPATTPPIGIAAFEYGFLPWSAFDMGEGDFVLIVDA